MICSVASCSKPLATMGWCQAHYLRWKHHGDLRPNDPIGRFRAKCRICGKQAQAHAGGLCNAHYRRWKAKGDPLAPGKVQHPPGAVCAVDGCERPQRGKQWCARHYSQWRRTGSLDYAHSTTDPCPICGGVVDRTRSAKRRFCTQACSYSALNGRPSWKVLAERDGWACHICGDEVDASLNHRAAGYPSADHVIPRSLGGSDDYSNLLLAHRGCNSGRQARGVAESRERSRVRLQVAA